jgi:carboxymethylenebutenolidase
MSRLSVALATVAFGWAVAAYPTRGAEPQFLEVVESTGSFVAHGRPIRVERYEPRKPGKYPAVLVLHGSGGMSVGGPAFREAARTLASRGLVAHLVMYFDATGTSSASRSAMLQHFGTWLKVAAEGLTHLSRHPNVDANRLGLVGFSLGGYLSLSLSVFDPRVSFVVDFFGGLPAPVARHMQGFPPTLILHGEDDRIVDPSEARTLAALLKARNVPHELALYPNQGHGFVGAAADDARRRVAEFVEKHTQTSSTTRHQVARPLFDRIDSLRQEAVRQGLLRP